MIKFILGFIIGAISSLVLYTCIIASKENDRNE